MHRGWWVAFVLAVGACSSADAREPDRKAPRPAASTRPVAAAVHDAHAKTRPPAATTPPPRPKRVLQFGDSMVGYGHGLSRALKKRFQAANIEYHWDAWTSAGIQTFDGSARMKRLLAAFKPDLVLVNLGTNNLSYPHPEVLAGHIQSIARTLGAHGRQCVWIGPIRPKWKWNPATLEVIRDNVAPCRYFDSTVVDPKLQSDHIHPTDPGGEAWAKVIWPTLGVAEDP